MRRDRDNKKAHALLPVCLAWENPHPTFLRILKRAEEYGGIDLPEQGDYEITPTFLEGKLYNLLRAVADELSEREVTYK